MAGFGGSVVVLAGAYGAEAEDLALGCCDPGGGWSGGIWEDFLPTLGASFDGQGVQEGIRELATVGELPGGDVDSGYTWGVIGSGFSDFHFAALFLIYANWKI